MKKILTAAILATLPIAMWAQSATDAIQISQPDFKGTARFMSMGGAFTALGGDLSTLGQNPAGVGVYRSSEFGVTVDFNWQQTKSEPNTPGFASKKSQFKTYCPNFGYIGTIPLYGAMRTFNWGVTYNRVASFDRIYSGYCGSLPMSLTNYIAAFTNASGYTNAELTYVENSYNPYAVGECDWLSILAYNTGMINGVPGTNNEYYGQYQNGTVGDAIFNVHEKGFVDEYNITFGGNVENVLYWGLGFGITDIDYTRYAYYSESMDNARIPTADDSGKITGLVSGKSEYDLINKKRITGSGFNVKLGAILRPINELRIGVAVHTPTWYKLDQTYYGDVKFTYDDVNRPESKYNPYIGSDYTDDAFFSWQYDSPWRLMAGIAGVIGTKAIISVDYEYDDYNDMKIQVPVYDYFGVSEYEDDTFGNDNIKRYCRGTSQIRAGLEYRLTPQISLRAGYNVQFSNISDNASAPNTRMEIETSGSDPSYSFDKTTQYFSLGAGYRYKFWYIDAAYVHKYRQSTYHAFTNFDSNIAPMSTITDNNNSLVISTGFKF